jgi:hypothetical protein
MVAEKVAYAEVELAEGSPLVSELVRLLAHDLTIPNALFPDKRQ